MANKEHVEKLKEGVQAWNTWRQTEDGKRPDLSGLELSLNGQEFPGVNLSNTNLSKSTFRGFNAKKADFTNADLSSAKFLDANLAGAKAVGAQLFDAEFHRSDLSHFSISEESSSSGSLPVFDGPLPVFDKSSERLSTSFIGLLAGLGYCLITILQTPDLDIITNSSSSPLPFLGANMPTISFSIAAPIVLILVSLYFHLTLQRHWNVLSRLPAKFPDGTPIDRKVHPWLLNTFARRYFERLDDEALNLLAVNTGYLLAYYSTPIVLFFFWAWFLKGQSGWLSGLHATLFVTGCGIALTSQARTRKVLRRGATDPLSSRDRYRIIINWVLLVSVLSSCLVILSVAMVESDRRWGKLFFREWAELANQDVSLRGKPPNSDKLQYVEGARLPLVKLRKVNADTAFMANAILWNADLSGADLSGANLRGADLRSANLAGAIVQFADLSQTRLNGADFSKVKFWRLIAAIDGACCLAEVKNAHPDFIAWAEKQGALVKRPELSPPVRNKPHD